MARKLSRRLIRLAEDTRYDDQVLKSEAFKDADPARLSSYVTSQLAHRFKMSLGQALGQFKKIKDPSKALDMITTASNLGRRVLLGTEWNKSGDVKGAAVLYHSLHHIRQVTMMGRILFFARYMLPGWRWVIEVQAYRQQVAVHRHYGASEEDCTRMCQSIASALYRDYRLRRFDEDQFLVETERILNG